MDQLMPTTASNSSFNVLFSSQNVNRSCAIAILRKRVCNSSEIMTEVSETWRALLVFKHCVLSDLETKMPGADYGSNTSHPPFDLKINMRSHHLQAGWCFLVGR
jgi:hypothetical protein